MDLKDKTKIFENKQCFILNKNEKGKAQTLCMSLIDRFCYELTPSYLTSCLFYLVSLISGSVQSSLSLSLSLTTLSLSFSHSLCNTIYALLSIWPVRLDVGSVDSGAILCSFASIAATSLCLSHPSSLSSSLCVSLCHTACHLRYCMFPLCFFEEGEGEEEEAEEEEAKRNQHGELEKWIIIA